jgi:hypothetical protein
MAYPIAAMTAGGARGKTSYLEITDITAGSAEADKTLGH